MNILDAIKDLPEEQMKELKDVVRKAAQLLLTDEEFEQTLKDEMDLVTEILNSEKTDHFSAHLSAYGLKREDGKREAVHMIMVNMPELRIREEAFKELGAKLSESLINYSPVMVILTVEAWTKQFTPEEEKKRDRPVSEYNDKKECILVSGITMDLREKAIMSLIERDKDNKIKLQKPKDMVNTEAYILRAFMRGLAMQRMNKNKSKEEKKVVN